MFEDRDGADRVCGDCQTDPPPFARARAAALYDGPVTQAITRFKFSRQLAFLPVMQHWLKHPLCLELVAAADLLAPVPLHPKRIKHRGFNQALLLAQGFPRGAGGPGGGGPHPPHRAPGGPQPQRAPGQRQRGLFP